MGRCQLVILDCPPTSRSEDNVVQAHHVFHEDCLRMSNEVQLCLAYSPETCEEGTSCLVECTELPVVTQQHADPYCYPVCYPE